MRARSLSLPSSLYRALGALAVATVMALVSPLAAAGVENPGDTPAVHAVRMNVDLLHRVVAEHMAFIRAHRDEIGQLDDN